MVEASKLIKEIEKKNFLPFYFLMGEEPYYIDKITTALLNNVLSEEEKSFNLDIIYGKDTNANQIISIARQFPLMSDYRLVVVKEAQEIKDIEELSSYFSSIQQQSIVVINYKYKSIDKRKSLYKELTKHKAIILESTKVKDYQVNAFISQLVQSKNRTIDTKAASMLTDFLGNDLSKIENEVDKLCILVQTGAMITDEIIEKNIGISKDFNNFEFISAIASKDQTKALKIANYFAENEKTHPVVVTIAMVYNYFSLLLQHHGVVHKNKNLSIKDVAERLKKKDWQLKDSELGIKNYTMKQVSRNINYLKEFDLKVKGVQSSNVSYRDLINEFLTKIFS